VKLRPFEQVDEVRFTDRAEDIRRRRGEPLRATRNSVALNELDYGDAVYRFQDNGRLEEVTLQPQVVDLGHVAVPPHALAPFIHEHDPEAFRRADFLVSPRYGLAFDPADPRWITALARHCLPSWRAL
jgi:hypothetical protein